MSCHGFHDHQVTFEVKKSSRGKNILNFKNRVFICSEALDSKNNKTIEVLSKKTQNSLRKHQILDQNTQIPFQRHILN